MYLLIIPDQLALDHLVDLVKTTTITGLYLVFVIHLEKNQSFDSFR